MCKHVCDVFLFLRVREEELGVVQMEKTDFTFTDGTVTKGYGCASGMHESDRFPEGTLAMQFPLFKEKGLDLSHYYRGTLNVSIKPHKYSVIKPKYTFENVHWHPLYTETFSFMDCLVEIDGTDYTGLVYYPHPETKPEHFQDDSVLELLLPKIANVPEGTKIRLGLVPEQIKVCDDI